MCRLGLARVRDSDVGAEANHIVPAQQLEHLIETLIAKASIGQQRDGDLGRDGARETLDERDLGIGAKTVAESRLPHGLPAKRRGAAMRGNQVGA